MYEYFIDYSANVGGNAWEVPDIMENTLFGQRLEKMPFVRSLAAERDALRTQVTELREQLARVTKEYNREVAKVSAERDRFKTVFAPGHYQSPVPNLSELLLQDKRLFETVSETIPGVDLNVPGQEQH